MIEIKDKDVEIISGDARDFLEEEGYLIDTLKADQWYLYEIIQAADFGTSYRLCRIIHGEMINASMTSQPLEKRGITIDEFIEVGKILILQKYEDDEDDENIVPDWMVKKHRENLRSALRKGAIEIRQEAFHRSKNRPWNN